MLILVLSLLSWMGPALLVRGEALSLRTREFVEAVHAAGARSPRIIVRHLVPNVIGVIGVNATFQVADAVLTLAVLSYLGFSLPPPPRRGGECSRMASTTCTTATGGRSGPRRQ
ncbi:MAG: ABC transporter permease subunit [Acidimicrobiales bacterium]